MFMNLFKISWVTQPQTLTSLRRFCEVFFFFHLLLFFSLPFLYRRRSSHFGKGHLSLWLHFYCVFPFIYSFIVFSGAQYLYPTFFIVATWLVVGYPILLCRCKL